MIGHLGRLLGTKRATAASPAAPTLRRPPRVAFITTLGRNVGDDFIREGIRSFLDEAIGDYDAFYVNKHDLSTLHQPAGDEVGLLGDKLRDADLIVQAGAPVFWNLGDSKCYREEWVRELWFERIFKLTPEKPFLNLGAGTCQAGEDDLAPLVDDPECVAFVKEVGQSGLLNTARDPLTARLMESVGAECELIPCPAFHAARRFDDGKPRMPRPVLAVNLMELAGHYLLDARSDPKRWSGVILEMLERLRKRYSLLFVAHDEAERRFLTHCNRNDEMIFWSADYRDYLSVYSRVAGIVANRVHGALCVAGFGRPAVIVGNDSRIAIGRPIGIPVHDSADVTADWIVESIDEQMDRADELFAERLVLRESSAARYVRQIRDRLARHPAAGTFAVR